MPLWWVPPPTRLETLPDTIIHCDRLRCTLPARVCVTRQAVSERQRTTQLSRGQGTTFPTCGSMCGQGRDVREALERDGRITWRGHGPGGRFERGRDGVAVQEAARLRKARTGLLERVPTLDDEP